MLGGVCRPTPPHDMRPAQIEPFIRQLAAARFVRVTTRRYDTIAVVSSSILPGWSRRSDTKIMLIAG